MLWGFTRERGCWEGGDVCVYVGGGGGGGQRLIQKQTGRQTDKLYHYSR